ncbi:MAG: hypothetical protein U9Q82_13485 [Chloroflexota bacterium]|nr:hypothetical protein [Chloroflexota bacterium]
MNTLKKNWLFLLILTSCTIYMGVYIYQTSFISHGTRYFVLFDDAMISMRYAKNLAERHGLVWNPGEAPVEGYTNPLWVIFMAIFHLFPIPAAKISFAIQISGAVFLLANLFFVKKISEKLSNNFIVPLLSVILTAFYTPLLNWGLQGMEVSILTLILSAAILKALINLDNEEFSPWPYILLGISTLVRIDMAMPFLVLIGFQFIFDPRHRRQHLLWGLGLLAAFIISQTLFRWWYYGDPLPNTYYLKMSGFPLLTRIKRGLYVLYEFVWDLNWLLFILPFFVLLFKYDRRTLLLALIFLGQVAYSLYVGGDAWEHKGGANRYIAVSIPLFFTIFVCSVEQIIQALLTRAKVNAPPSIPPPRGEAEKLSPRSGGSWRGVGKEWLSAKDNPLPTKIIANAGLVTLVLISMVNFNFLQNNPRDLERWLLRRQPNFVAGNKYYLDIVHAVEKITTPQARIAVVSAGAIPYFSERPAIDLLGKNDVYIAHLPSHIPSSLIDVRPGHLKWDYDYAIGELKPDMILQLWGDKETAYAYIEKYYTVVEIDGMKFSARSDSPEILWENTESTP